MKDIFTRGSIFALIAAAMLFSCNEPQKTNNMKIEWNKLGSDGLQGDLAKRVSAVYRNPLPTVFRFPSPVVHYG